MGAVSPIRPPVFDYSTQIFVLPTKKKLKNAFLNTTLLLPWYIKN